MPVTCEEKERKKKGDCLYRSANMKEKVKLYVDSLWNDVKTNGKDTYSHSYESFDKKKREKKNTVSFWYAGNNENTKINNSSFTYYMKEKECTCGALKKIKKKSGDGKKPCKTV